MIIDTNNIPNINNFVFKAIYIVEKTLDKCQSFIRIEKLDNILGERKPKSEIKIVTNGKIGAVFQDYGLFNIYELKGGLNTVDKPYLLGKINEYKIFVDPYMRWDDDRIIIKKNDIELYNIIIKNGMDLI